MITLETLQGLIRQAGYTNSQFDFETETEIRAFSAESNGPRNPHWSQAKNFALYDKTTGTMLVPTPNGERVSVKVGK